METIDYFYKLLDKGPLLAIASISLACNVIFGTLYLKANHAYIELLKNNIKTLQDLNKFFGRFKSPELNEAEEESEEVEKKSDVSINKKD